MQTTFFLVSRQWLMALKLPSLKFGQNSFSTVDFDVFQKYKPSEKAMPILCGSLWYWSRLVLWVKIMLTIKSTKKNSISSEVHIAESREMHEYYFPITKVTAAESFSSPIHRKRRSNVCKGKIFSLNLQNFSSKTINSCQQYTNIVDNKFQLISIVE